MARITIILAAILILLGLVGYFGTTNGEPSVTALIPSMFGAVLTLLGVAALNPKLLKHAMHAAVMVSLLGFLMAGGRGLMKVGVLFSDDPAADARPVKFVLSMAAICGVHVLLCVRSFIQVRKARARAAA